MRLCVAVFGVALLCTLAVGLAGAASKRAVIAFGSERGGPFRIHVVGMFARNSDLCRLTVSSSS